MPNNFAVSIPEHPQLDGAAIRKSREAAGFTLTYLAAVSRTSEDTIRRAESGRNTPGATTVAAIARALGVTMDSLFVDLP